jgi:hypothetical protein
MVNSMPHSNGFYSNRHYTLSVDLLERLLSALADIDDAIEGGNMRLAQRLMNDVRDIAGQLRPAVYTLDPGERSEN